MHSVKPGIIRRFSRTDDQ